MVKTSRAEGSLSSQQKGVPTTPRGFPAVDGVLHQPISFNVKIKAAVAMLFPMHNADGSAVVRAANSLLSGNRTIQQSPHINGGILPDRFSLNKPHLAQMHKVISKGSRAEVVYAENFKGGSIARVRKPYGKIFPFGGIRLPQGCGYLLVVSLASGLGSLKVLE